MSPLKYIRWSRMQGAHLDFRAAHPSSSPVTETGLRWGFTELGRFAGDYRQLLGELPRETMARETGTATRDLYKARRNDV